MRAAGTGDQGPGTGAVGGDIRSPVPGSPSLVFQTSFLGDMVLTTPLLAELATRGPVDVVATPAAASLLANHPAVREVIVYDKRGRDRGIGGLRRLARAVRGCGAAKAYFAQGSLRSAALGWLAGIPERVGFATAPGRALYSRRVPYRDDRHHAERLWRLAGEGAEPSAERIRPRLYPGAAERAAVDAVLDAHGARARSFVALAPGSVWATKRWPYFPELARRLAERGTLVVIVGGGADAESAVGILAEVPAGSAIDATGRLSLLASAELIGRAAALVTNDSSPQHLASAMDTPTVAVFGPTHPSFGFGPLATRSAVAGHEGLDCRPCHHHGPPRCPLGHWRCMRELDAAGILALVDRVTTSTTS
jgi:heptosyltransferase II